MRCIVPKDTEIFIFSNFSAFGMDQTDTSLVGKPGKWQLPGCSPKETRRISRIQTQTQTPKVKCFFFVKNDLRKYIKIKVGEISEGVFTSVPSSQKMNQITVPLT